MRKERHLFGDDFSWVVLMRFATSDLVTGLREDNWVPENSISKLLKLTAFETL